MIAVQHIPSASRSRPARQLPRPRRFLDLPPRQLEERLDPIDALGRQVRGLRQLAAVVSADDDPRDAILAEAGLAERGH
jgi:hypothetical protein